MTDRRSNELVLGIVISAEQANEDHAESLGIATSALNENQKKVAFRTAVIDQAKRRIEKGQER